MVVLTRQVHENLHDQFCFLFMLNNASSMD